MKKKKKTTPHRDLVYNNPRSDHQDGDDPEQKRNEQELKDRTLYDDTDQPKKKKLKKVNKFMNQVRTKVQTKGHDISDVQVPSDPAPDIGSGNLIGVGGIHPFHETVEWTVELCNRLYPIPESVLREDTESSFYIFQVNPYRVLKRGVKGYENTKQVTTQIRKRMGLKFDEIKFKKERSMRTDYGYSGRRTGGQTFRGGRIDTATNYNPSKHGYFRGVNYSDGSYADLD